MKKKLALLLVAIMLAVGLVACSPSPDDVKKGLEDAGYTVVKTTEDGVTSLACTKGTDILNFAVHSDDADKLKEIKAAAALVGTVKEKGNWIYYGSADFIKAIEKLL